MRKALLPGRLKSLFTSATLLLLTKAQKRLLLAVLILHFLLSAFIAFRQGLTSDESSYYGYVINWMNGDYSRSTATEDSKSPVIVLVAAPLLLRHWLPAHWANNYGTGYIKAGRLMMYVYFLPLAFFSFLLFYRLCGPQKWLVPLLLLLFNPMVPGYCMLVGTDIALSGATVASVYLLWRLACTCRHRYFWWLCIVVPVGLVLKQSYLYVLVLLVLLALLFYRQYPVWRQWLSGKKAMTGIMVLAVSSIVIVNSFFGWRQSFVPFEQISFQSKMLQNIQQHSRFLAKVPVPLPYGFLNGYDLLQLHAEWGSSHPQSTYQGVTIWNISRPEGPVPVYYVLAAVFKLPLLYWLLGIAGVGYLVHSFIKKTAFANLSRYGFVLVSFVFLLLVISLLNPFQISFRHALLLFPFACALLGQVGYWCRRQAGRLPVFVIAGLQVISIARYGWCQLAYTNELIWNKLTVYHYLNDSSVDYGQDNAWAQEFVQHHPEYHLFAPQPRPGKYILYVSSFSPLNKPAIYRANWLIHHFKPVGHFHFIGMVYEVSAADLKSKGLL